MKRLFGLIAVLLLAVMFSGEQVQSQIVNSGGGGGGTGAANSIQFTNGSLPITSASAGAQCLQTNAGTTAVVLGACGGGGSYPAGSPPQIGGFSALNTSEGETVSGDGTFARLGANSYGLTVTKTGGVAFTSAATTVIGTSGATIPLLSTANTWSGVQTHNNSTIKLLGSSTGGTTFTSANAGASNFTLTIPAATDTLALLGATQSFTGVNTFNNSSIKLLGSSTGATTFTSANAGASNFTLTIPAATDTLALLGANQTFTGADTFSTPPVMSGGNISSATIPSTALVNTAVTAGSYTNTNLTVNAQGQITAASNGAGGGGSNPMFPHTLTLSAGAATMVVNSSSVPTIDTDYVTLTANATITTPNSSGMADTQEIYLVAYTTGSAFTVGFTPGTGITLATIVLGDGTPFGTPAACGTIPATGSAWYKWKYSSSNTNLTLIACGINAPATSLAASLGGSGTVSPTAHALLMGEGSSPYGTIPAATAGNIVIDQGAGADWLSKPVVGDATLALNGTLTVTKTNGTAFGALATLGVGTGLTSSGGNLNLTTPVSLANGGTAVTAISSWPIATNVNTSVGSATNISPSATFWITNQDITMTAAATITLLVPTFANQMENLKVCQNGTGGFAPTFAQGAGLTITGTFPTCTTTASKCCDMGLYFDSTSTAYITGSNAGPL